MGVVTSHQATANLVSTRQEEDHLFRGHANDRTEMLEGGITDGGATLFQRTVVLQAWSVVP